MALVPEEGGIAAAPATVRAGILHRTGTAKENAAPGKGWVKAMPWLESAVHSVLHDREPVVGVDITPGHIRVCQMVQQDDNWELHALASANVDVDQTIYDIRQHEAMYVQALKELLQGHGIKTKYAAIGLPLSSSIVRTITTANMADSDIESAIAMGTFWQSIVQLSVKLKDYSVYYEILSRDEAAGTMDILFVASRNADLTLYNGILKQAGMQPMVADVQCFALQNAFRMNHDEAEGGPTVLLKFGMDENYIMLTDRNKPYMYEIYIPDNERETIHEQIVNPEFVQRFANQVKQILVKHAAKNPGSGQVKKICMVSLLPTLSAFVEQVNTALPDHEVTQWDPFLHVAVPPALAEKMKAEENPTAWAVPMGLAVRSLTIVDWFHHKDDADHVNLIPQTKDFIKAQRVGLFSKLGLSVYLVVAIAVAIVMAGAVMQQVSSVNKQLRELENIEKEHAVKNAIVGVLRGRVKKLETLEKFIAERPSNQKVLLEVYESTASVIPEGVWLNKIQFTPVSSVEMTGRALDDAGILTFIHGLDNSEKFSKVTLKAMQAEQDENTGAAVKVYTLVGTVGVLQSIEDAREKAAAAAAKAKEDAAKAAAVPSAAQ